MMGEPSGLDLGDAIDSIEVAAGLGMTVPTPSGTTAFIATVNRPMWMPLRKSMMLGVFSTRTRAQYEILMWAENLMSEVPKISTHLNRLALDGFLSDPANKRTREHIAETCGADEEETLDYLNAFGWATLGASWEIQEYKMDAVLIDAEVHR